MKTKIRQTAAILAAAAVMAASLTACSNSKEKDSTDSSVSSADGAADKSSENLVKMMYKTEQKEFPEELGTVEAVRSSGEKLTILSSYIPASGGENGEKAKLFLSEQDADGNITNTAELPLTPDDGSAWINNSFISNDGTVYYTMVHNPDGDVSNAERTMTLKSVKPDGSENYSFDLAGLSGGFDMNLSYIRSICADGSGRAVICVDSTVYGIGADGRELFALDQNNIMAGSGYVIGAVQGSDGNVYISYLDYSGESYVTHFVKLDIDGKTTLDDITVDGNADYVFNVGGDYLLGYSYGSVVKGVKADGSSEEIINIANAGVDTSSARYVFPMGDKYSVWYTDTLDYSTKEAVVVKLDESEAQEKIGVTLSALELTSSLRSAVVNYNNSDGDYFIEITDYSADDYETAKTKINAEISAGNIPDIICMESDSIGEYAKKGLLLDLNSYIDGENGIDRENYFDNIFKGMETNGKLYAITDAFIYMGFGAKKSIIPEDGSVSYADIEKVREQYEDIALLPVNAMTKSNFMNGVMSYGIQKFVDKNTNECSFNSSEFVDMLKLADEYPAEIDQEALANDPNAEAEMQTQYAANKTLFMPFELSGYADYSLWEQAWFGEEMSVLGFPGMEMDPVIMPISSIAVSSKSSHPDAGWELIKYMLSDEIQEKIPYYFPVNKTAMKSFADRTLKEYENYGQDVITYWVNNMELKMNVPDQKLIDRVNGLIESTDNVAYYDSKNITDIVTDEANSFFSGASTAETAAENIQKRVMLYLSEQE